MGEHRKLARVTSADLYIEDHGILTVLVMLDFGSSGQGFGGYALDEWSEEDRRRVGTAAGADFVLRLLSVFGAESLSKLKGRMVYALTESDAFGAKIIGIQMTEPDGGAKFLIEDWRKRWFK